MKKRFMMFTLLATAFSGMVHADDAAIRQSLAKLGVQSTEIQPAPVAGMKTVLTNSGELFTVDRLWLIHYWLEMRPSVLDFAFHILLSFPPIL